MNIYWVSATHHMLAIQWVHMAKGAYILAESTDLKQVKKDKTIQIM